MSYLPSRTFPDASQQAEVWVAEFAEHLHCERRQAYEALRSALHAVRDSVGLQGGIDLANHLPMLIRGLFYENWHLAEASGDQGSIDLAIEVSKRLKHVDLDAGRVVEEFFKLLESRLGTEAFMKLDMVSKSAIPKKSPAFTG